MNNNAPTRGSMSALRMTRVKTSLALVALGVLYGSFMQQLMWSASFLALPHTPQLAPSAEDQRRAQFARLETPPSEIFILGERNSGTKYAAGVLRNAFVPPTRSSRGHEYFSTNIPVFPFKHMFRHTLLNETELAEISNRTDVLWILAVRSPCAWAEAMKRLPWHMCHPNNIALECPGRYIGSEHTKELMRYSLSEFFQMEWGDWPESSNFRNLSFVGNDFMYRNVFQLRKLKLMLMRQVIDTVPRNVKIMRLHELEQSPETFVKVWHLFSPIHTYPMIS